jgi:hypothetical protein
MKKQGGSYFMFIDEEIPATNNEAEQAVQAIVTDRKVTRRREVNGQPADGTVPE